MIFPASPINAGFESGNFHEGNLLGSWTDYVVETSASSHRGAAPSEPGAIPRFIHQESYDRHRAEESYRRTCREWFVSGPDTSENGEIMSDEIMTEDGVRIQPVGKVLRGRRHYER